MGPSTLRAATSHKMVRQKILSEERLMHIILQATS